jgi:hypothetical protein
MSQTRISEATTTSKVGGSYVGPMQPGARIFKKKELGPFIVPTSIFDNAELAYDSYDGELDVSKEVAERKERIARAIAKYNLEHPQDTDEDGNPLDVSGNKSYMAVPMNESNLRKTIKKVLKEYYDRDKLYVFDNLMRRLQIEQAPHEIKSIVKKQTKIPCENNHGEKKMCIKIPEVVHVYLTGRY